MITNKLEIALSEGDSRYSTVSFGGNLDTYGLSESRKDIMKIVDDFTKEFLVFDFTNLNFLNSESIGFLMQVNEKLFEKNKKLVLVQAKKNVLDVLQVIGLFETMPYYSTMQEFVSSMTNAD